MAAQPIPDGYHTVTPYLIIDGAARAIEFYKQAFGATEVSRMDGPGGKLMHAEIKIGDSPVMLADEVPDMGYQGPKALGGTPLSLMLYVEDVDARFRQALDAGAEERRPVADQFYGDRCGTLEDPFGHLWTLATHIEDVAPEDMQKRFEEMMQPQSA